MASDKKIFWIVGLLAAGMLFTSPSTAGQPGDLVVLADAGAAPRDLAIDGAAFGLLPQPRVALSGGVELRPGGPGSGRPAVGRWRPYGHRYSIVVMGGSQPPGQLYDWYWNDTSGMVWTLMDWGFAPEDIHYFSYGDSAAAHPELVDGTSNAAAIETAFDSVAAAATEDDLVYVWWVDHGNTNGFLAHDGLVYFTELRDWIDSIRCRAYVGAYNPCYSGAIMPHMEGLCDSTRIVITATSVDATHGNSYGWAGMWRMALRGGRPTATVPHYSDVNGDGYVSIDEAYEWEAPHSNGAGEHPLLDDNCDGVGGDYSDPATYDPLGLNGDLDGYYSQFYSVMAWYDTTATAREDGFALGSARPGRAGALGRRGGDRPVAVPIVWTTGAPMPNPVARGASGLADGKVYLFGGHPSPAYIRYVYDIATDTWTGSSSPLPTPGSLTRGVVVGGDLYVFGGHTAGSDTMMRYLPDIDAWEKLSSPYPTGWRECCKYGAGVADGIIHYYYMEDRYRYAPDLSSWHYDVASDAWSLGRAAPAPKRMYVASASDGHYCYAVGGIAHDDSLTVLADAIRYLPVTDFWASIDPIPEPIAFADGDFLGDTLFVVGGGAGYEPWPASDQVWCWSEETGWLTATPLPAPVGCPHVEVATIDDRSLIFVFGGYNEGYLNTLYIGEIGLTGIEDDDWPELEGPRLSQNRPNPFHAGTSIAFEVPFRCDVRLEVYDVAGRKVATLVDGPRDPGVWTETWDAAEMASGVYMVRLWAAGETVARKMVVLK